MHRLYKASFGRRPLLSEFLTDTQAIGNGVVVNLPGWEQLLEHNKQTFSFASKADQIHLSVTPGFSPVIEDEARARTVLTVYCFRETSEVPLS